MVHSDVLKFKQNQGFTCDTKVNRPEGSKNQDIADKVGLAWCNFPLILWLSLDRRHSSRNSWNSTSLSHQKMTSGAGSVTENVRVLSLLSDDTHQFHTS